MTERQKNDDIEKKKKKKKKGNVGNKNMIDHTWYA